MVMYYRVFVVYQCMPYRKKTTYTTCRSVVSMMFPHTLLEDVLGETTNLSWASETYSTPYALKKSTKSFVLIALNRKPPV